MGALVIGSKRYMTKELVSILLPTYNSSNSIAQCVESILCQTYRNIELIIINDGSTDDTLEVLQGYESEKVRVYSLESNQGIVAALNYGASFCKGDYIARADSDDLYHPSRIETQVNFLNENLSVGICGTFQNIFGGYNDGKNKTSIEHDEIIISLLFGPTMLHPTVMFRASVLSDLTRSGKKLYNPDYYLCEDYELWVRASYLTRFANIPEFLCSYRWDSEKNWELNSVKLLAGLKKIWTTNMHDLNISLDHNFFDVFLILSGRAKPKLKTLVYLNKLTYLILRNNFSIKKYNRKKLFLKLVHLIYKNWGRYFLNFFKK